MIRSDSHRSRYVLPFFIVMHPIDGYDELHYRRKASWRMSVFHHGVDGGALLVFQALLAEQWTGPQITMVDADSVNLLRTLFGRLAIVALFVLSNWAFCVLADGKGRLGDVWIVTTYSLQPYIYAGILQVILSHFLTQDESAFLSILMFAGVAWSFVLLISGLMTYHEYELFKALTSLLVTAIGMLLIAFLVFLFYSLYQQVSDALLTIFNEFVFRIRQAR